MYLKKISSGPISTNAYLFGCPETQKYAVIDPSMGSCGSFPDNIAMILLTHSHWDHIADVYPLKEKTGAPVYVHKLDAGNVIKPGSDGLPLHGFTILGVKPDHYLEEGQILQLGNLKIEVIHTPYHSPGSVCFFIREEGVLFSGDALFKGNIGGTHLPTAQPSLMKSSLGKLGQLPPDTRVFPGHGDETTIEKEKRFLCR